MNDRMHMLVAVGATVLYEKDGIIAALLYLEEHGWTRTESIDLLTLVDNLKEMVAKGQLK